MKYKENNKNGFTLVELLAVIVILAIILVIAVPKVMSIIEDAKMGTLESTAKMIASQAEKQKVQNTVLGNNKEITCDSVAKINKGDYASCSIKFEDNIAKVTIEGSGKFDGLWVCEGTKTEAKAIKGNSCELFIQNIEVSHPLFFKGETLTTDKFKVTATYSDGSTRILENGTGSFVDESKIMTITSPNWPEKYQSKRKNYDENNDIENELLDYVWEETFEGAEAIQVTFDETFGLADGFLGDNHFKDSLYVNDYKVLSGGTTYTVNGDKLKIRLNSYYITQYGYYSPDEGQPIGFNATIKPIYKSKSEFTVSPSLIPDSDGNFDIRIALNEEDLIKKVTTNVGAHNASEYISRHKGFDTVQTNAEYNGTTYDAGIRYVGEMDEVKNKVYYNCDDIDINGVSYGENNYDYESSCEVWRIIGLFDTKTNENSTPIKRVKLVNTSSTFAASWDLSSDDVNEGRGINQWGESGDYEGADLMRLLNGYYIGKENSICTYCNDSNQGICEQTCTADSLKNANMKSLTNNAKNMIDNAVWDTYAVNYMWDLSDTNSAGIAYLQEKGISQQYTGKSECENLGVDWCSDQVTRTTSWTGLVGLMSASDKAYSKYWLEDYSKLSWTLTSYAGNIEPVYVWVRISEDDPDNVASYFNIVWPSVYLKSDIKIIGGNGDTEPYKLAL